MAKKKNKSQHNQQKKFSEKDYLRTKMRTLPIGKCYISPIPSDASEVTVFVTRLHPAGSVSLGMYLIDKYCCGIKDAICKFSIGSDELQEILDSQDERCGIREVPYVESHNLIYGALEYAESIGIPPHSDFALCQYILAEDNDDIPLIEYEFGCKGRPTLMSFSKKEIDYYKKMMLKKLKPEEFDVVILGQMSEPSDDDSEDEPEEDERINFYNKALGITSRDRLKEIRSLDDVRKVGFFIIVGAIAREIKAVDKCIASLSEATDRAISNYRKYGDVAFGESTDLLCEAVLWAMDLKNTNIIVNLGEKDSDTVFLLCMAYHHGVTRIQLCQRDFIRQAIDDAANSEEVLLDFFESWVKILMETVNVMVENVDNKDAATPFRVTGLDNIEGKWSGKAVKTHVRNFKYRFVSADPEHYYKRKVREAIDTRFVNDEDFMGLVFFLSNIVVSAYNMVQENEEVCATNMLYSVIIETSYAICARKFDQWIAVDDLYANIKVVLSNAVTILSNMIIRGMVDDENVCIIHKECKRLDLMMKTLNTDFVDLHPLIFSTEYIMYEDADK